VHLASDQKIPVQIRAGSFHYFKDNFKNRRLLFNIMPLFIYMCGDCGQSAEYLLPKSNAVPENGCSNCNSYDLVRDLTGQTFAARGSKKSDVMQSNGPNMDLTARVIASMREHFNHGDDGVEITLSPAGVKVRGYKLVESTDPKKMN
jgi:predicted nucleic acid-binding Zn ribbon protein